MSCSKSIFAYKSGHSKSYVLLIGMTIEMESWHIVGKTPYSNDDSEWIEEEDRLINWAEAPLFVKLPLDNVEIRFIYVTATNDIIGSLKTAIDLEPLEMSSLIYRSEFYDKVTIAKTPCSIFTESNQSHDWMQKTYTFEDAAMYLIPPVHDQLEFFDKKIPFVPFHFSKDVVKIPNSFPIFHDIYEIIVIMREVKPISNLKSGSRLCSKPGKTKKVRISDDSPKEFIYSNITPVSGKRRTKKRIIS